jgi:ribonuclease PH
VLAARAVGFTEPVEQVAAVSLGVVGGEILLDLDYREDSSADVDMNVVMTAAGRVIEIQATAEREPFGRDVLDSLLVLAERGVEQMAAAQRLAVAPA